MFKKHKIYVFFFQKSLFSSKLNNGRPVRRCLCHLFCQSPKMIFTKNIHVKICTQFLFALFIHRIFLILLYISELLYIAFCLEKE